MRKKLITQVSALVEAPLDTVRDPLFDALLPDGSQRGRFEVEDSPGHTATAEVADYELALQGGWWYRGEWQIDAQGDGTLVTHTVYNAATRARWGVGLANKFFVGFEESTKESFLKTVMDVAHSIGAPPPRIVTRSL